MIDAMYHPIPPNIIVKEPAINTHKQHDLTDVYKAIQRYVDKNIISGAASIILKDKQVVDSHTWGYVDMENKIPYSTDSICRIYSNTKIIVSVAAMMLWQEDRFDLDDPIDKYLTRLSNLKVLKPNATSVDAIEDMASKPTIRQLMCHSAGFSYGVFAESKVDDLYKARGIIDPKSNLENMVAKLADIPLAYQPGTRFQYSISTDILGRLIEVLSDQSLDDFLKTHILHPLSMFDTDFWVAADKQSRFAVNYVPVDLMDPMKGGLSVQADTIMGSYAAPRSFLSGGGGLVSTIIDYGRFIQMLVGQGAFDGVRLLKPETVKLMHSRQLPAGVDVTLPEWLMPNTTFGLGLAIKTAPAAGEPDAAKGEYHWGGIGGTHTWVSPDSGIAALLFTQRLPGFWHPFSHDFKREVYKALSRF